MASLVTRKEADKGYEFLTKCKTMTKAKDRGGLIYPKSEFYLMIRELESVARKVVNINNLHAQSMDTTNLQEQMLDSILTKYYWEKLAANLISPLPSRVLENIIQLFLKMRGYAVARHLRRQASKTLSADKRKSKSEQPKSRSLRKTLQNINNKLAP